MTHSGRTYGQAKALASELILHPTHHAMVVYIHDATADVIKGYLREWVPSFPALADWEKRVTFRNFNEKPKLETLPKITIDEWPEVPSIAEQFWDAHERLQRQAEILYGADPKLFKEKKS